MNEGMNEIHLCGLWILCVFYGTAYKVQSDTLPCSFCSQRSASVIIDDKTLLFMQFIIQRGRKKKL